MTALDAAATWLFTPADNVRALDSPQAAGADARIIDLEDGCRQDGLAAARANAASATAQLSPVQEVWLRVHPTSDRESLAADIENAVVRETAGVLLPKVEGTRDVELTVSLLERRCAALQRDPCTMRIGVLVETAAAVFALRDLAFHRSVSRLFVGELDLAASLSVRRESEVIAVCRAAVVIASRAARLDGPVASPWLDVSDDDGMRRTAARAYGDGFSGMLCVHPRQLPIVRQAFGPSEDELEWSRAVVDAAMSHDDGGAFLLRGRMIDAPVIAQARDVLRERGTR